MVGPSSAEVLLASKSLGLDGPLVVEMMGDPNLVCANGMGLLMTIDGTRDGISGSAFDMMALLMSLVKGAKVEC